MRIRLFVSTALLTVAGGLLCRAAYSAAPLPAGEAREGFVSLFDGLSLDGWQGAKENYAVAACWPTIWNQPLVRSSSASLKSTWPAASRAEHI